MAFQTLTYTSYMRDHIEAVPIVQAHGAHVMGYPLEVSSLACVQYRYDSNRV